MSTSNTYNFQNTPTDDILKEAFQRCGMGAEGISMIQAQSGKSSLNYMFADWVNRGLNLFAVDLQAFSIIPAQSTYILPVGTVDLLEGTAAIFNRQLNGTPYSSAGGDAANAFDGNPNTACTQTTPDGYISYDYGVGVAYNIQYIGVTSFVTTTYSLVIEYSYDNDSWYECYNVGEMNYTAGQTNWFVPQAPQEAEFWRIRETGGATLNINEIYFDTHVTSRILTRISREDYLSIPNKYLDQATPSSYLVYRTNTPTLILWPNPDMSYPMFVYTRKRYIQDVSALIQNVDSPQRFLEAVAAGLAARLSLKYFPERYDLLNQEADRAYTRAAQEDVERVPMRIFPDRCYEYSF